MKLFIPGFEFPVNVKSQVEADFIISRLVSNGNINPKLADFCSVIYINSDSELKGIMPY